MTKFRVVASGMVRSAPLTQLPSAGISLGVSGSDVFHITELLRNSLSIFCEFGSSAQFAKNLLMVIFEPLALVISMLISFRFVTALSDTDGQIGSEGAEGVAVGMVVIVGVRVGG